MASLQNKTVLSGSPTAVWGQTKHAAGITRKLYRDYFKGAKRAYAIELAEVCPLQIPLNPVDISNGFKVPQSFRYVDRTFLNKVMQKGSATANIVVPKRLVPITGIDDSFLYDLKKINQKG